MEEVKQGGPFYQTFSAVLHPLASRLTINSHWASITLANIMAGDTCEPTSLPDFEGYLAFREHAIENLQFVVWYQDYRKRFFELKASAQSLSPSPSDLKLPVSNIPASSEHRPLLNTSANPTQSDLYIPLGEGSSRDRSTSDIALPSSSSSRVSLHVNADRSAPLLRPPLSPTLVSDSSKIQPISPGSMKQPFRQECMRIIATFLRPGAVKELALDDDVRFGVIKQLASSTHPDIFLPVYRGVYDLLETKSLPRFLAHNNTLSYLPRQLFWYGFGIIDILLGIAISVSLIMTIPIPPQTRRAWRLFGVPFIAVGAMQLYSAWRGFYGQLWLRSRVQLREWELQEVEEDAKVFWNRLLHTIDQPPLPDHQDNYIWHWDPEANKYVMLTDTGTDLTGTVTFRHPETNSSSDSHHRRPHLPRSFRVPTSPTRNGFFRPPVFGPDKVVLDPKIKAGHRRVMSEIILIGVLFALLFSAIVISVPGLRRS